MGSADLCRNPTIRRPVAATARPEPLAPGGPCRAERLPRVLGSTAVVPVVDTLALATPLLSDARQPVVTLSMTALSLLLIGAAGRYRRRLHLSVLDELPAVLGRLIAAATLIATVIALYDARPAVVTFVENSAMAAVLVIGGRVLTTGLIGWSRQRGSAMHRAVIVGGGALAAELIDVLDSDRAYGLAVDGFVDTSHDRLAADVVPWLGPVSTLDSVVADWGVDTLLVAGGDDPECALATALRAPTCLGAAVFVVPRLHHLHLAPEPVDRVGSVAVVRVLGPNLVGAARTTRRVVDAAMAVLAVALLAPPAGLRALTSGRRELPHSVTDLWRVVRGDMGLVGPRPEPLEDATWSPYECYRLRDRARPGLTGLAQVNGLRGRARAHERARYDNWYIETWTPWLDVKIAGVAIAQLVAGREP
jgi:hypothetical protein